jgi:hypothetical protein
MRPRSVQEKGWIRSRARLSSIGTSDEGISDYMIDISRKVKDRHVIQTFGANIKENYAIVNRSYV